jgi:hypothetical protein
MRLFSWLIRGDLEMLKGGKIKLEEHIERVLCAQELELDGNAWKGNYELNDKGSIVQFILNKLRKVYTNLATDKDIKVSKRSAEKLATHSGEAYQKSLVHIPEIIEKMQFLAEMKADKADAHFKEYLYYITPAKIDEESYTILSTVGFSGEKIYYDQNVFEGTPEGVFEEARSSTSKKYSRLNEILTGIKKDSWDTSEISSSERPATSTNKYSKFSEEKQDLCENFLQI